MVAAGNAPAIPIPRCILPLRIPSDAKEVVIYDNSGKAIQGGVGESGEAIVAAGYYYLLVIWLIALLKLLIRSNCWKSGDQKAPAAHTVSIRCYREKVRYDLPQLNCCTRYCH